MFVCLQEKPNNAVMSEKVDHEILKFVCNQVTKSHEILMFVCLQKDAKQCCDATKLSCTHCACQRLKLSTSTMSAVELF